MARVYAGTSGFSYASWKPDFYPEDLPAKKFLQHYSGRLNCVEINYTFRRLPSISTLENWVNASAPGFLFCPKAHMRITHVLRLRESEFTNIFFRSLDPLRNPGRLGPILVQLPPNFKCNLEILAAFLDSLPEGRVAFEFRDDSWLTDPVYRLLERFGAALCIAETDKLDVPEVRTTDFLYFRLRKPEYSIEDRQKIAARTKKFRDSGNDVFVFFKHEESPEGALYAEELLREFQGIEDTESGVKVISQDRRTGLPAKPIKD